MEIDGGQEHEADQRLRRIRAMREAAGKSSHQMFYIRGQLLPMKRDCGWIQSWAETDFDEGP